MIDSTLSATFSPGSSSTICCLVLTTSAQLFAIAMMLTRPRARLDRCNTRPKESCPHLPGPDLRVLHGQISAGGELCAASGQREQASSKRKRAHARCCSFAQEIRDNQCHCTGLFGSQGAGTATKPWDVETFNKRILWTLRP